MVRRDLALAATIGANVRARRIRLDRTLHTVAESAGMSMGMVSKIENGVALPSVTALVRLAHALGVRPGTLFAEPMREAA